MLFLCFVHGSRLQKSDSILCFMDVISPQGLDEVLLLCFVHVGTDVRVEKQSRE